MSDGWSIYYLDEMAPAQLHNVIAEAVGERTVSMAHWHDYNPWAAELVYLPDLEELSELLDPFQPRRHLRRWQEEFGLNVDAYILPQPSGWHSCGIRYGKEPENYVSPEINRRIAELLLLKYRGNGAPRP